MSKLTLQRLLLASFLAFLIIAIATGCGLGFRIKPNGMTFKWDWPDNVSSLLPEKNLPAGEPPLTRSPPPG
jgi:hypothetical protein